MAADEIRHIERDVPEGSGMGVERLPSRDLSISSHTSETSSHLIKGDEANDRDATILAELVAGILRRSAAE
ncbi:MAG: hypothetical protein AB7T37_04140 [Dehalococcoidia bacterium]